MTIDVRPMTRADRDQVAALVNGHISAVIPNLSLSVNTLLNHLEREPGEFIVDPWVSERVTLVAVQRSRVVAAAHLLRYRDDEQTSAAYRDAAEIRWLLCWPPAPYWPDSLEAGQRLVELSLTVLDRWQPRLTFADGTLPVPGVYGVPDAWPHVRRLYADAGFVLPESGRTEIVYVSRVDDLRGVPTPEVEDLTAVRSVGINGTRFTALSHGTEVGMIEVDTVLHGAPRMARDDGWADVGNLEVAERFRRRGVGRWLVGQAADWLDLGGVSRLLNYGDADDDSWNAFCRAIGFEAVSRNERGFMLPS